MDTFYGWWRMGWGKKLAVVAGLISTAVVGQILKALPKVQEALSPELISALPMLLNTLVLILICCFFIWRRPRIDRGQFKNESARVELFNTIWMWFWGIFAAVYAYNTLAEFFNWNPFDQDSNLLLTHTTQFLWLKLIDNFLSNVTLLFLFFAYTTLGGYDVRMVIPSGIIAVATLGLIEVALILACGRNGMEPTTRLFISMIWQIFLGAIACTVFALFVGRVESKLIAPPLWMVFCLYMYAALQVVAQTLDGITPLSVAVADLGKVIDNLKVLREGIIYLAVFLKVLLFGTVYWLLQSGVLLFYFSWIEKTSDAVHGVDMERKNFVNGLQGVQ